MSAGGGCEVLTDRTGCGMVKNRDSGKILHVMKFLIKLQGTVRSSYARP